MIKKCQSYNRKHKWVFFSSVHDIIHCILNMALCCKINNHHILIASLLLKFVFSNRQFLTTSTHWITSSSIHNTSIINAAIKYHHHFWLAPLWVCRTTRNQKPPMWAILTASVNVRLWDSRSFRTVFIHVIQGNGIK